MIDDRRLLCAFIYSAYASGFCGLNLDKKEREDHMLLYKDFVSGKSDYFPEDEIASTQKKMSDRVSSSSIRDYVYRGHPRVIGERIEAELGGSFSEMVSSSSMARALASRCAVGLYEVTSVNQDFIVGRHLYLVGEPKTLQVLDGLERPSVGDTVSGHWDYMLEVVSDEMPYFAEYKSSMKEHFSRLR